MSVVLITGGTGMIGYALTRILLDKGHQVNIVTRNLPHRSGKAGEVNLSVPEEDSRVRYYSWNIREQTMDPNAIRQADYIIHLAGASVAAKRWTAKRKKEIVDSRVKSSELLVKGIKENKNNIKAVISASAIGWYGPDLPSPQGEGQGVRLETDPPANDFLGQTCKLWEDSIEPVTLSGIRLVKLRTGIVLSNKGGALVEFKKPLRFGIAAIPGSGIQVISWIHIDDLVNMFIYAMENETMSGVYNAVAPHPVSNKKLVGALARSLKGKFYIPVHVPAFLLKLVLGEMSIEVLKSTKVSSEKIIKTGFAFQYPDIQTALENLSLNISS